MNGRVLNNQMIFHYIHNHKNISINSMNNLIDLERSVLQFKLIDINEMTRLQREASTCEFCSHNCTNK